MPPRTNASSETLGALIKSRRNDLVLTIADAAKRAGVTEKTWIRYESGASIRSDKVQGVLRALNWNSFPSDESDASEYSPLDSIGETHAAWSSWLSETFGRYTATLFACGVELAIDLTREELEELSVKPRGSHLGELSFSLLATELPPQFLTRYDYEFVFTLQHSILVLRNLARYNLEVTPNSVMEELALRLIVKLGENHFEMFGLSDEYIDECPDGLCDALFEDCDLDTCLYGASSFVTPGHVYHFNEWNQEFRSVR